MSDRKGMDKNAGDGPHDPNTEQQGGPGTQADTQASAADNGGNNNAGGGDDPNSANAADNSGAQQAPAADTAKVDKPNNGHKQQGGKKKHKHGNKADHRQAQAAQASHRAADSKTTSGAQTAAPGKPAAPKHESAAAAGRGGAAAGTSGGGSNNDDSRGGGKIAAIVAIIALIIAIIALVGAAWIWHSSQLRRSNISHRIDAMQSNVAAEVRDMVMPRVTDIRARIGDVADTNAQQRKTLSAISKELKQTQLQVAGLAQQLQGDIRRWQLQQIEQLLVTANRRLQLYRAPQQAKAALKLASQAISRLNDPRLFAVRKRIADEIAALNALPSPDIEGLALTLAAFVEQVPELPLASDVPSTYESEGGETAIESATGVDVNSGWQRFLASLKTALHSMVTVRRADGTQTALLPPDQVYFLTQNLVLELRAARLALLEGNGTLYRQSLSTAIDWLQRYFSTDAAAVSAMIQRLKQMQNIQLDWQAPDISGSLRALRSYMHERNQEQVRAQQNSDAVTDQNAAPQQSGQGEAPQQGDQGAAQQQGDQ